MSTSILRAPAWSPALCSWVHAMPSSELGGDVLPVPRPQGAAGLWHQCNSPMNSVLPDGKRGDSPSRVECLSVFPFSLSSLLCCTEISHFAPWLGQEEGKNLPQPRGCSSNWGYFSHTKHINVQQSRTWRGYPFQIARESAGLLLLSHSAKMVLVLAVGAGFRLWCRQLSWQQVAGHSAVAWS